MNFKKISTITLASAAMMLCSCAKTLSYNEAKEWVSNNYTRVEKTINCTRGKDVYDFSRTTGACIDVVKEVFKEYYGKDDLNSDYTEYPPKSEFFSYTDVLNKNTFGELVAESEEEFNKDGTSVELKGKILTVHYTYVVNEEEPELFPGDYKVYAQEIFNHEGIATECVFEYKDIRIDGADGAINGVIHSYFFID